MKDLPRVYLRLQTCISLLCRHLFLFFQTNTSIVIIITTRRFIDLSHPRRNAFHFKYYYCFIDEADCTLVATQIHLSLEELSTDEGYLSSGLIEP